MDWAKTGLLTIWCLLTVFALMLVICAFVDAISGKVNGALILPWVLLIFAGLALHTLILYIACYVKESK